LIHPSHIFLATPLLSFSSFPFSITLFHSLIHIFFLSLLLLFFFFLSFPYTYFPLYFPSLDIFISLFKALNSSLSCINTI
jgi:hypothetical protein